MADGGTAALAGGSLVGGMMGAAASEEAAQIQAEQADRVLALQQRMYEENIARQKPFYEAGLSGQNRLLELLGVGGDRTVKDYGSMAKTFSGQDMYADPGYNFRLQEGLKGLDRTAAARGGALSGGALRGATRYGQDYASNEYQNAFNRFNANRAAILNPLQSLTGAGQTGANQLAAAGNEFATGAGNTMTGAGNALAAGSVGSANAWSSAINNAANAYNQNQIMKQVLGSSTGTMSA